MGSQFTLTARRTADASPGRATQRAEGTQTKQLGRASAAPQASLLQREFAAPGGTTIPRTLAGIPPLAPGEISPPPFAHPRLRLPLQRKLAIGAVGDPLESEADAMAEHVMRRVAPGAPSHSQHAPALRRKCACGGSCDKCKDEEKSTLQRKVAGAITPTEAPPIVHQVLRSPGRPLDSETRSFMEPRFGRDFSNVRVHTDSAAAQSAKAVNAAAYTVGSHISFAEGSFAPSTYQGRTLLAHELAHTVQQGGGLESPSQANRLSRSPEMLARQATTADAQAAAAEGAVLDSIAQASFAAPAFGIPPTNPVWAQLDPLWMVGLLHILEKADRLGHLKALDRNVDQARGIFKERLRLAIDAVKLKRDQGQVTVIDTGFEARLKILPPQQQKEIFDYLTAAKPGAVILSVTPAEKSQQANAVDYLHPPTRTANANPPAQESAFDKFTREHAKELLQLPAWGDHFGQGMSKSALPGKLGEAWAQLKGDLSSASRFVRFYFGMQVGVPVGAVKDVYNQLEGIAQVLLVAFLFKLQLEADPLKVWADLKKFAQGLPDMLIRLFDAEQLGIQAGNALAAKVDQDFVKQSAFDQGKAIGEIIGAILMEVALLFVGVEEVSAGIKALRGAVLGEEVARGMALTSKELRAIVEARGLLKLEEGVAEGAAKDAKLLEGAEGKAAPATAGTAVPKADVLEGVTEETRTVFNSEAKRPVKKALEDNPLAARALKRCKSLCYPDFVTKTQIERLEKILQDAEDLHFHVNLENLQEELRNPALKTAEDFDHTLNQVQQHLDHQAELAKDIRDRVGPPRDERVDEFTPRQSAGQVKEKLDRITQFRRDSKLPAYRQLDGSSGTVALVEVDETLFFGTNSKLSDSIALTQAEREIWFNRLKSQGKLRDLKNLSDAQFLSHAEAGSLIRAYERSGATPLSESLDLFVDRPTCNNCRENLRELAEVLGVKNIHIYYVGQSGPPVLVASW